VFVLSLAQYRVKCKVNLLLLNFTISASCNRYQRYQLPNPIKIINR
jgi:hypothetical protein